MNQYGLNFPFVHAIEVTAQYVNSLPNAGAILQKFGEQVEILHQGPVPKKTYAQVGEFIVCFKDANGKDSYAVISNVAFKGLFKDYHDAPAHNHPERPSHGLSDPDHIHDPAGQLAPHDVSHPGTGEPPQGKPATDTSTLSKDSVGHQQGSAQHQTEQQKAQQPGEAQPPLTEAQQKEQKRQERLKELKNSDMSIEEKPLGKGHKDI